MNPTPRANQFWLVLLATFWAFYGLVGRDAWKSEEALALAPILDWLAGHTSAWATPAPLYTLVAGLLAKLAGSHWNIQDGARLASGVFTLTSLLFTGAAARTLDPRRQLLARRSTSIRTETIPVEGVVPDLRRVVEQPTVGLHDDVLEGGLLELRALDELVQVRHVGLVVLAVVVLQGLGRDVRGECILGVRERREFERHGGPLCRVGRGLVPAGATRRR